ncbi:signal peptide peptidase SppA [bacterium]|nr:signal peptide peptidase SppA [bacterium]
MKNLIISTLLITLLLSLPLHAQVAPDFLTLPYYSVADVDNAFSTFVNPAGLGIKNGYSHFIIAPIDENEKNYDFGLVLGGQFFGFTCEFIRNDLTANRNRYTTGFGLGKEWLYGGVAYSWTSGLDRQNNWDAGVIVRPLRFISFGAVVHGINQPRVFDKYLNKNTLTSPGCDLGVAFRPLWLLHNSLNWFGNRLTFNADAKLRKYDYTYLQSGMIDINNTDNYDENIEWYFGANVEILPGVIGNFTYSPELEEGPHQHDEKFVAGVTIKIGIEETGYISDKENGTGWVGFTELYHPTILKKKHERFVKIKLQGSLIEYQSDNSIWRPKQRTLYELIRQIERYGEDPDIAGIVIRFDNFSAGWAKLQEIREALLDFEYSGKSVVAYLENCGNGGYYIASVADQVFMNPVGRLNLSGLAVHSMYLRGTLDWIGINPQFTRTGRYKTAMDQYTRENMSNGEREALDYVLDELFDIYIKDIADGRGYIEEQMLELIDDGPFTAADAFSAGLVDSLIYDDQIEDVLKYFFNKKVTLITEKKQEKYIKPDYTWYDLREKTVAIIFATGAITTGESSEGGLFSGKTMGSSTMMRAIRKAREDKKVKAIVLRIDSPGGSVLASDIIMREVKRCGEDENPKPVIVSMSDVAGSGGYYIACMADTIIAMSGTITGSIGVISGKMSFNDLFKKLKIKSETLTRGKHADMWNIDHSFTDEEWTKLNKETNQYYQTFLERVAEGRDLEIYDVDSVAQGRIWTGEQAADRKLVDLTGGLAFAIQVAAQSANIREGESFRIKLLPSGYDFDLGNEFMSAAMRNMPENLQKLVGVLNTETNWEDGESLLLMPYTIEIE